MSNKFLSYDEQRATKVHALFTKLARRYDLINDVQSLGLHRIWKRRAVRLAMKDAGPNSRVLDLCCGTGDMAFEAARNGAGEVVGVDFTEAMLEIAKSRQQSGDRIQFVRGDALNLPFPDKSFDAVTVGYGFRNVSNLEACLNEMLRVVRPGGSIVILDFGKPDNRLIRAMYFSSLRMIQPIMGWLFHGDSETYRYIFESLMNYPAQRGIETMMLHAGMTRIAVFNPMFGTMGINYGERSA